MLDVWALAKLARPLSVRQLFSRMRGVTVYITINSYLFSAAFQTIIFA